MFSTQNNHRKDGATQFTQSILRALISEKHFVSQTHWVLALVRQKKSEHAFLLIEGLKGAERKLFRSDLFMANHQRSGSSESVYGGSSLERLWNVSSSLGHSTAFIRLQELSDNEYDALIDRDNSQFQCWRIAIDEAEELFKKLISEADKPRIPFNIAGDHPSWISSTSTPYYHNCVSWCQEVIRDVFKGQIEVGTCWGNFIKRPSDIIWQVQEKAIEAQTGYRSGY